MPRSEFNSRLVAHKFMKTNLKCKRCKKDIPKVDYDEKLQLATWFGLYRGTELLEWICLDCWNKGIKHEKTRS